MEVTKNHPEWLEPRGAGITVQEEIVSFPTAPESQGKELGSYSR